MQLYITTRSVTNLYKLINGLHKKGFKRDINRTIGVIGLDHKVITERNGDHMAALTALLLILNPPVGLALLLLLGLGGYKG